MPPNVSDGRQPHVRVGVDHAVRAASRESQSSSSNSSPRAERRAAALGPPDHPLLLVERRCGPTARSACGSAAPRGSAAGHPRLIVGRADPDVLVERRPSSALMLLRSVLEPEQVSRCRPACRGRRGAAEPELRPLHRGRAEADAGEVADGVHGDLRVVGARLDRDVAAAARRVEVVRREVRQLDQRRGLLGRRSPNRSSNSEGPNPMVRVSWLGAQAERLAGVAAAERSCAPPIAPSGVVSSPAVIRSAISVHFFSSATSSSRDFVVTSNATKCMRSCAGVTMPGLVLAAERDHVGVRCRRLGAVTRPTTAPAPASAAPAPTAPNSRAGTVLPGGWWRRCRCCGRFSGRLTAPATTPWTWLTSAEQGVDLVATVPALRFGDSVVGDEPVARAVLGEFRVERRRNAE